jgi:hypothetical protein
MPSPLDPLLQRAIAAGVMSEAQARDVDALADGITARLLAGEITEEQAQALAEWAAVRDGQAVNRARARAQQGNRAARRAAAAEQRKRR